MARFFFRRYVYKFINNLDKILGYSPTDLHSMMGITTLEASALSDDRRSHKTSGTRKRKSKNNSASKSVDNKIAKDVKLEWTGSNQSNNVPNLLPQPSIIKSPNYSPHVQYCGEPAINMFCIFIHKNK